MKHKIVITAIVVIGLLEAVALSQGIDGQIFTGVIAVLAGLAGLAVKQPKWLGGK